jgi:site-specific DNA-adenine methylase
VDNYVEPFAGSLAVLLARQDDRWQTGAETVNDTDAYLCNFWRALSAGPEQVAHYADWPVNETDLLARHLWLVETGRQRIASLESDPEFYDAKVAGWWVWGINSWIGSGWCKGNGPWRVVDGAVRYTGDKGGQWRQLPHLVDAGQGVNRKRPHLGSRGEHATQRIAQAGGLLDYFAALAARLRRVRVCCGDWARVVTDGALACGDTVGVFLDPPYLGDVRAADLYRTDDHTISTAVRDWAVAHGDDKRLRIVLVGYEAEHEAAMPATWRRYAYSANAAYQKAGGKGANNTNRHNERLWFSPHCLRPGNGDVQMGLFGEEQ